MNTIKKAKVRRLDLLLVVAGILSFAGAARAQLVTNNVYIYFDSFARSNGPVPLNGTAPDVADATGATWTANFTMECLTNTTYGDLSGVCEIQPSASLDPTTAYLPFTPQAGHFYTLTCDLNVIQDSSIDFGFQGDTNSSFGYAPGVGPWLEEPLYGGPANAHPGGSAPSTSGGNWPNHGFVTSQITLDTTEAQWVAKFWLLKGAVSPPVLVDTYTYPVGQNPTGIATVGMWAYNGNATSGDFDNFKLLDTYVTSASTQLVTNNTAIYQDSFSRTGPLDGSSPDEFDAAGATWTANFTMVCATNGMFNDWDGICVIMPSAGLDPTTAYLPFTPQTGHLYTLTCDMDCFADSSIDVGFQGQINTNYSYASEVGPWVETPFYGGAATLHTGGAGPSMGGPASEWPNTGAVTWQTTLDTTGAQWVVSFYQITYPGDANSNLFAGTYTYPVGQNPTNIASVGMWAYNGNPTAGYFDNFTLVDTVVQSAAPPSLISEPPASLSGLPGAYVPLTVDASGLVPLSYQWTLNGSNILGATDSSFIVANLGSGTAGTYGLVITNLVGTNKAVSVVVSMIPATVVTDYLDSFSRSGILSNTAPNVADLNGAKWDATTNLLTDGTQALQNPTNYSTGGTNGMIVVEAVNYTSNLPSADGTHNWVFTTTPDNLLSNAANTIFSAAGVMEAQPNVGVNEGNASTAGPELTYNVNFSSAGTYYVWVRGIGNSPPGPSDSDSVLVGLDGTLTTAIGNTGWTPAQGFYWDGPGNILGGTSATIVVPTAGPHVLNVWMREDGFDFDELLLTTNSNYTPTNAASFNALLPLTVQLGHMYRLSVDMDPTADFLAFGFRNAEASSSYWDNGGQVAWMEVPAGGNPLQAFYGGDNGLGVGLPNAGTNYTTYTIVLDTTSTLQWTATYLEGNTVLAQYTYGTILSAPLPLDIGDVGLWGDSASLGGWENFTLVDTVPLQIPSPVVITAPVSNTVAYDGAQEVTFSATGFGETPLYYVWRHDGQIISVSTSGTLTLSNIYSGDAGNYTLTISNAYGVTNLPSISLEVPSLPGGIVLYQDSFTTNQSSAPYYLGGSTPDLVDLPGATWVAADGFIRNESNCVVLGPPPAIGSGQNAFLPFKPQLGHIYTLSVDVLPTNDLSQVVDQRGYEASQGGLLGPSPDGILAVGFNAIDPANNLWWDNGQCLEWVGVPAYPDDYVQAEAGNGFNGPFQMCGTPYNLYPEYNNYCILLDTSTGDATTGWTLTYLENGLQIAQFVLKNNQPVGTAYVGLGATGAVGAFRNFSLTDAPVINLTVEKSGANVVVTWYQGTLLEATDLNGPWTPTAYTSPYTNAPGAGTQMFYTVSVPYTVPPE